MSLSSGEVCIVDSHEFPTTHDGLFCIFKLTSSSLLFRDTLLPRRGNHLTSEDKLD